jgi:hypothetical protein
VSRPLKRAGGRTSAIPVVDGESGQSDEFVRQRVELFESVGPRSAADREEEGCETLQAFQNEQTSQAEIAPWVSEQEFPMISVA